MHGGKTFYREDAKNAKEEIKEIKESLSLMGKNSEISKRSFQLQQLLWQASLTEALCSAVA
jgi:hypothetical protein